jgi:hypothetical protein
MPGIIIPVNRVVVVLWVDELWVLQRLVYGMQLVWDPTVLRMRVWLRGWLWAAAVTCIALVVVLMRAMSLVMVLQLRVNNGVHVRVCHYCPSSYGSSCSVAMEYRGVGV